MSAPRSQITNWAGNVTFGSPRVHRPGSVDELRRLVRDSARIRALGSGHSFNLVADSDQDLVRLDGLPEETVIDAGNSTVTVTAGTRYAELVTALDAEGFALANLASLPHISVAGSCATGTHGSGDGQRCLSAAVRAVQLVGPDGGLSWLSRDADPGVFPGVVVALGALGIVTRLSLEVEPAFEMFQEVRVGVPLEEAADHVDDVFGAAYSVSLFTDWRDEGVVWFKQRADRPGAGWDGGRPAQRPMHPVPGMSTESSTEQMGVVGPWHERLPHFRPGLEPSGAGEELQSELYVPREYARDAFTALRGIGRLVAPVLHTAEVRTVRADDLWLSPAHGRDCVAFHFTWVKDLAAVTPVLAAVEERLLPLGARPHWGKLTTTAAPDIAAMYERAADFARLMRDLDPTGKFRNAFVDGLFPLG
ncbi:D-arabinono-1,4-lactone oxidase [Nocardiopsis halotolerans]|uniref:D-arabinono-1,4-lactone oxidase n=1 Tax=Nocardiopsis halotolerans TaxID=124252 RepID=UPI0003478DE6|nr:D-arabinono-1,4-lactone oxidase [Nocardiopsis halotolerans]